jgi:chromosome partitioning protein
MRKIAVITSKGGTGKTTTSINFGHAAAMMGKRTLMVDCDAQGSLSLAFGLNGVQGLSDLLLTDRVDIYNVRQNLFLVGSGKSDIYRLKGIWCNKLTWITRWPGLWTVSRG